MTPRQVVAITLAEIRMLAAYDTLDAAKGTLAWADTDQEAKAARKAVKAAEKELDGAIAAYGLAVSPPTQTVAW